MGHISSLPFYLEDVDTLLKRQAAAARRKELWRSTYTEAYRYAMPARENFNWSTEGSEKQQQLFDSTLQELTYEAANTLCALLFPSWKRWANLGPGGAIPKDAPQYAEVEKGLQKATDVFFEFLNDSNFATVINETALDLMVGTGALMFDEGDMTKPFVFTSVPLAALELEEGPDGSIETEFMCRKPAARNITRMYPGTESFDLSAAIQTAIVTSPDTEFEIVQCHVYDPQTKKYFGIALEKATKNIFWRWDYDKSCPMIVARATKTAGELYGRGRVLQALPDARTLNKMQEFVLRQAALAVAPPMTGVSDGVLNPYTATVQPNTIIPVSSNATDNPSLRVMENRANFSITEKLMDDLRERLRRAMLGPEGSTGQPLSASEINIADRNRLWAMNGEFNRIQSELLTKIVARGVFILQRKGIIPRFEIDGREVNIRYDSPFARSQNSEDVLALQSTLNTLLPLGPELISLGIKVENLPEWVSRKSGVDMSLVRDEDERKQKGEELAQAAAVAAAAEAEGAAA
jgi:hypothetical protein